MWLQSPAWRSVLSFVSGHLSQPTPFLSLWHCDPSLHLFLPHSPVLRLEPRKLSAHPSGLFSVLLARCWFFLLASVTAYPLDLSPKCTSFGESFPKILVPYALSVLKHHSLFSNLFSLPSPVSILYWSCLCCVYLHLLYRKQAPVGQKEDSTIHQHIPSSGVVM